MAPRGAPGRREAFPNAQRALVLALEIGDDIGALAVIRDTGEAHGRAPEITQGKFEEAVQSLPIPDDAGGSDGVGIDLVGGVGARPLADHDAQAGAESGGVALEERDYLEDKMTADQIREARKQALEWARSRP